MAYLPLPYIQLEGARTNAADYLDTQWNAGYGFSVQFAGCTFTDGGYLFGAMTAEDSADKFALQFQDGKYIYYFGDQTAESPATYELGEPHFFSLSGSSWSIDGVGMPTISFYLSPSNEMTLPVYVGAVNVGGEAQLLSDVQIGYINFNGSSGGWQWYQCKTQDGKFGFYCTTKFVEKPEFTYGGVMAAQSGTMLAIVGAPTKKDYKLGEPFDPTGMTVYLNLDDGTQRDITDEVSPNSRSYTYFNSNKIYRSGYVPYLYYRYNPVGVEYNNFQFGGGREYSVSLPQTLYYTVSTDSPVESIEVTKLPDKTEYLIKEYFSTTGMIVTGHLENGETAEIGDSTSYSGISYQLSTAGTFDVTVNWYDGSKYLYADPFQITVKNGVEKLNITPPAKTEYGIGDSFESDGITVTALYLDGTETPISEFTVDSSKFDSTKEGGYEIIVKATVDEKEYTESMMVYVFGEPKKLEDLLGTTEGMTVIRNNVKNDDDKDTVPGVDWFVFDGNTAANIYVSGNNFISFDNTTEHVKICRHDGAIYYVYSQVGKLDNGHKFLKIRVDGYTYYSSTASQYALKYELFLFDDNSMFLNIVKAPTNTSYLGTSELYYGSTHLPFTVQPGVAPQPFSFYTTDAEQGMPWTVENDYHEFIKEKFPTLTVVNGTGSGKYFPGQKVTVTANDMEGYSFLGWKGIDLKVKFVKFSRGSYPSDVTDGNMLVMYDDPNGATPAQYTGWTHIGMLNTGSKYLSVYSRIADSKESISKPYIYYIELENAYSIELEESTRQENIGYQNGFTCEKASGLYYLWFVQASGWDSSGTWTAVPDVVTELPGKDDTGAWRQMEVFIDDNEQPVQFNIKPSLSPSQISSFGFAVKSPTDANLRTLTFTMPDEDLTIEAEFTDISGITAVPTKREYSIGDSFDATAFTVESVKFDGTTSPVTEFTAVCETFNGQSEGRYPVTITAEINGVEFTAETLVVVYGEPHDILDLLNTKNGMERKAETGFFDVNYFGDVRWFSFDGKAIEKIGLKSRGHVYFNENEVLNICSNGGTNNYALVQEGILKNGHKFFKLKVEPAFKEYYADYELFLFDDNSMYLNIISPPKSESSSLETRLTWSDGEIEIPVKYGESQKASFYTDNPSEGKPWTMELDYHEFIKEKMRTLTVNGGSGSGKYLPGENVTVKSDSKEGYRFSRWISNGELFVQKPKIINTDSGISLTGLKEGNLVVFANRFGTSEENVTSIDGWTYDGTLTESGDREAGSVAYTSYINIFHKINDFDIYTGRSGYFFEIENADSIELNESTRQENLLLSSANDFLCNKETDDLYLWFFYATYWSEDRTWVAQPNVVSYFPNAESSDSKNFSVLIDENIPPVSFRVKVSSEMPTRYGSGIGVRIVPSCTGYESEMTFSMPDEDLTIEAEFEPRIKELDITSMPLKTDYQPGESFEKSGLKVDAVYYDGTRKPITDYVLAGFDSNTSGQKTITITYTEKDDIVTASFTVSVGASGIVIESYPKKKSYALGEQLDTEGLSVAMAYADNSSSPIEDLEITGFDSDEVGAKTVNVTYKQDGNTYNSSYTVYVTEDGQNPFSGYNPTRTMRIHSRDGRFTDITGAEIESESMTLTQSIGNDSNLRFGGCVASQFSVNIFSEQFLQPDTYPDGDIEVYIEANGQAMKIFTGTIESAKRVGGLNKRKLIAYDYLKRKSGIKLKNWYNSLEFPMSQRVFRQKLFEYVGIEHRNVSLKYDNAHVPDNMNVESLTFLSLIKDICLCNMCFGRINADGQFDYVFLNANGYSESGETQYRTAQHVIPDDEVINCTFNEGKVWYPQTFWINPNPNDPEQGQKEPTDLQAYNGNIYFVRNSYMIGDWDWIKKAYRHELVNTGGDVYYEVYEKKYQIVEGPSVYVNNQAQLYLAREYSLTTPGDFMRQLGDGIQFHSIKYLEDGTPVTWTINSYIMSRTITGIVGLREVDSAKNSAYNEEVYGAAKEIRDNTDTMVSVQKILPKSTSLDDEGDSMDEPFKGIDTSSQKTWDEVQEELKTNPESVAAQELPNKFYAYKNPDGTAGLRYNGYTIAGGGGLKVESVTELPANPDNNTIYLIQGEVVVE